MMGRDQPSRSPSSTRATYSFIDQPRFADASFSQFVSRYASRNETIAFSSLTSGGVFGTRPPSLSCFVRRAVIHVNSMKYVVPNLETGPATRLDRWIDRPVSSRNDEAANGSSFEAAADSAPRIQRVAPKPSARRERRADTCAPSRPPTPNDWIGWPGSGAGQEG